MNTLDVLKYGHLTVLGTIKGFPEDQWETAGVCGYWSVKQIIAHLASFEQVLVEVVGTFLEGGETPKLDEFMAGPALFNDNQVAKRGALSWQETQADYEGAHGLVMAQIARISQEKLPQPGTLPWYGLDYSLDDFLVYTHYGHRREHCAQINVFRDVVG